MTENEVITKATTTNAGQSIYFQDLVRDLELTDETAQNEIALISTVKTQKKEPTSNVQIKREKTEIDFGETMKIDAELVWAKNSVGFKYMSHISSIILRCLFWVYQIGLGYIG